MLENLLDFISELKDSTSSSKAVLFFRLKNNDDTFCIQKVNVSEETQAELFNKYCDVVYSKLSGFEGEENKILNIDDYDYTNNNDNTLYSFNKDQIEPNMEFLTHDDVFEDTLFNMNNMDKVDGIILRIGTADKFFNIYVPYFHIFSLSRDTRFIMKKMESQFVSDENEKMIRFNYRISFIYFEKKLLILDFKKLEREFKYSSKMNERATTKVKIFRECGLLSKNSTLESLIDTDKTIRNKILKIKADSPVLSVPKAALVSAVRSHPTLNKIPISDNGKFEVNSKVRARHFLKIIDDDFVKSYLTGKEYEAEKKSMLN